MDANSPTLTGSSCRAARAVLRWSSADLVERANVSPNTVAKIEGDEDVRKSTLAKVQATLEAAGVEILNGNSPGARLKPKQQDGVIILEESGEGPGVRLRTGGRG